jgi:hypothetical protein
MFELDIFANLGLQDPFPTFAQNLDNYYMAIGSLYAEDTSSLWRVPEIQEWIKAITKDVDEREFVPFLSSPQPFQVRNLQRLIFLKEIRSLYHLLPSRGMNNMMMYDPLPPDVEEIAPTMGTSLYSFFFGNQ